MNTNTVRWDVQNQFWQILEAGQWSSFDEWAKEQPDLSQINLQLSAESYLCRWIEMPGVSGRHLSKALPFALEDSLIEDIDSYHLVPAGKKGKFKHRVYITNAEILDRLKEACELHHVQLRELVTETSQTPDHSICKDGDYWLINIPPLLEAKVSQSNLAALLELALNQHDHVFPKLNIFSPALDEATLLKTQLESNFPDSFEDIEVGSRDLNSVIESSDLSGVNLLTGEFRAAEIKEDKPAVWWRTIAAMAAVWCVFMLTEVVLENKQLKAQQAEVHSQTLSLYKRIFPGERIRSLERQLNAKLKGDTSQGDAGFMALMHQSAKVLNNGHSDNIKWQTFKFNDRQNLLLIDLTANDITQLQSYKGDLEKSGLVVEIASATNEEKSVKGRLKIGGAS